MESQEVGGEVMLEYVLIACTIVVKKGANNGRGCYLDRTRTGESPLTRVINIHANFAKGTSDRRLAASAGRNSLSRSSTILG